MECGAEDFACQLATWLKDNDYVVAVLTKWLGDAGAQTAGFIGIVSVFLKLHGEKLIALAGASFGAYKWWVYREHILHKRLEEYLSQDKRTLGYSLSNVLASLDRPGKQPIGAISLYSNDQLKSVLRERGWHRKTTVLAVETGAQLQLAKSVNEIQAKLQTGEQNLSALRNQLATAHIVHGAIYSAKARRAAVTGTPLNHAALTFYRQALSVPEHENSVLAKELEAHELRKLGDFQAALEAYEELEKIATKSSDYRSQRLLIAKAKRYQALMIQARNSTLLANVERTFHASKNAYKLISDAEPDSAISIRANFSPYQDFELLEQGDIHYLAAFISHNNNYTDKELRHLNKADSCYRGLTSLSPSTWRDRKKSRALQKLGNDGVLRVSGARPEGQAKKYDWRWLLTN